MACKNDQPCFCPECEIEQYNLDISRKREYIDESIEHRFSKFIITFRDWNMKSKAHEKHDEIVNTFRAFLLDIGDLKVERDFHQYKKNTYEN